MTEKLKFYRVDPGGNITAIVKGTFPKRERFKISRAILKSDLKIEQVGFWIEPKNQKSVARLEMMGGEFCGNGARSLVFLIWKEQGISKNFTIESSGINKEVQTSVGRNFSKIKIPISSFSRPFANKSIISMPGICHLINDEKIKNKQKAKKILKENKLLGKEASGVISVKSKGKKVIINFFVWVRDTKTLYEETACASGTLALAYLKYKNGEGKSFVIIQPSGANFKVKFRDNDVSLSGPVKGYSIKEITI